MSTAVYYLGLAFLFTHELDAVTHSEWRLLPVLGGMTSAAASPLFVGFHVPLFFVVLWLSQHRLERVRSRARLVVSAFLVLHGVLHWGRSSDPQYDFHGVLSETLIWSAAGLGLAYLLIHWRSGDSPSDEAAV